MNQAETQRDTGADQLTAEANPEAKKGFLILDASEDYREFPDHQIVKVQEDGVTVGYALRVDPKTKETKGFRITYSESGAVKSQEELTPANLRKLNEEKVFEYLGKVKVAEREKFTLSLDAAEMVLHKTALAIAPTAKDFQDGNYKNQQKQYDPNNEAVVEARKVLRNLSDADQRELAQRYWKNTCGDNHTTASEGNAYVIYNCFKDTPFGEEFWRLQDTERKKQSGGKVGFAR
jgi:hypothetical protein